jgi:hypothetical protein
VKNLTKSLKVFCILIMAVVFVTISGCSAYWKDFRYCPEYCSPYYDDCCCCSHEKQDSK